MTASLPIISETGPSDTALAFARLADVCGIQTRFVSVCCLAEEGANLVLTTGSSAAAVFDLTSSAKGYAGEIITKVVDQICSAGGKVLLILTEATEAQCAVVMAATHGEISAAIECGQPVDIEFPHESAAMTGPLAGQRYRRDPSDAIAFGLVKGRRFSGLMQFREGETSFAVERRNGGNLFLWATPRIFDVKKPLCAEAEFEGAADEYIPGIIFLRETFGERCWHSLYIGADVVIDDPVLEEKYGFIKFPRLLQDIEELGSHLTIAFIPWNHWRSRPRNVSGFLKHRNRFSICAHGCDHIKGEFLTSDYEDLLRRSLKAAERLDNQCRTTGLGWDRFMVCPREEYSEEALRAFSDSGRFLGLTNTGCIPRGRSVEKVTAADLLLPAQDAFFGFPIFKRHYWSDMSVFAMALFLGKPAILVEHHSFFRDDHQRLRQFVSELQAMYPEIRWSGMELLGMRTCQRRRFGDGGFEVRFFTDVFELENPDTGARRFELIRRLPETQVIESVLVGSTAVQFNAERGLLRFSAELAPPRTDDNPGAAAVAAASAGKAQILDVHRSGGAAPDIIRTAGLLALAQRVGPLDRQPHRGKMRRAYTKMSARGVSLFQEAVPLDA